MVGAVMAGTAVGVDTAGAGDLDGASDGTGGWVSDGHTGAVIGVSAGIRGGTARTATTLTGTLR